MRIQVIHCGRIAQTDFLSVVAEYKKRLAGFCRVDDIELKADAQGRDKRSAGKSKDPIFRKSSGDFLVILDERGHSWTSLDFSKKIQTWTDDPRIKNLVFLVGPPYGFDEVSKREADEQWALSTLTMPSDFAWLMVWEQLYRAHTILKGMPYHHD